MDQYRNANNAVLVDIRTPEEYDEGHVAGAVNVDFYDANFLENMKALGSDKNFFIYCRTGGRSAEALQMLAHAGISAVDLPGGITAHPELL